MEADGLVGSSRRQGEGVGAGVSANGSNRGPDGTAGGSLRGDGDVSISPSDGWRGLGGGAAQAGGVTSVRAEANANRGCVEHP